MGRRRGVYISFDITSAVSAIRVAKPHSLSYQVRTRASLPSTTWVWGRAAVDEAAMWFRSVETNG